MAHRFSSHRAHSLLFPSLSSSAPALRRTAVRTAALSLCLAASAPAWAQPAAGTGVQQAAARDYDIPSGPLSPALSRFAGQAGVTLSSSPELTEGQTTAGLQGRHTLAGGFAQLLRGTGLEVVPVGTGSGVLTLRRSRATAAAADASATTLSTVTVEAAAERTGTTEGTGSYAARGPSTTATRLGLTARETPQTVSVITRQQMDDLNLTDMREVLEKTPGISVQNLGSERLNIYSRGYAVTNYQFDGVPTTVLTITQVSSQNLADTALYDRIEVLRGPAGLLTGAGDPSGTINVVRKRPTREFQGHVSGTAGSWDLYRAEADFSGPLNEAGTLRGRVVAVDQKNHSYMRGYRQDKQVLYGILEADLDRDTLLTFGVDHQDNDPRGVTDGFPLFYADGTQTRLPRTTNSGVRWGTNEQKVTNAFVNLDRKLPGDWRMTLAANYLRTDRSYASASASAGFLDRETGEGVSLYGGTGSARQKQLGFDAQLKGPFQWLGREHEAVIGFSTASYRNRHRPNDDDLEGREINLYQWNQETDQAVSQGLLMRYDHDIRQTAGYGVVRFKPAENLALIAGLRVSSYKYDFVQKYVSDQYARFDTRTRMRESGQLTPYAGLVYDLNAAHSVYGSYTSIFQPQSARTVQGQTLAPREGNQYEVGLKSQFLGGRVNTAVALFEIRQNHLAVSSPGEYVAGTTPREQAYRAVDGAKTRGIDLEVSGELATGWNVAASFSHSTTRADGLRLSTVAPEDMFKLSTTYRLPGEWRRLTIGGGVNWQSRTWFSATPWQLGKTVTAGQGAYALVNLMARYEFTPKFSMTLNVNNLTDKTYVSALDSLFYTGYYGAPRNVQLTARYQF